MSMQVTVEGKDITPEECLQPGWTTAISRRKSQSQPGASGRESSTQCGSGRGGPRTPAARGVKKRLTAASRLPHLPREHFRIIVRPRGGLDVRRISQIKVTQALAMAAQLAPAETEGDIVCPNVVQNIFVVSTPTERNARAYAKVEALLIGSARYEVNSYLAAPDNTCKGIVRGVDLDFDHNQLRDMIVQPRNPKALEVKRIKDTTTIVVLFDGLKVPNYVMCGASMFRCTLYRRQTDICYACGRLGHRADVCPAPEKTICRGCGIASPAKDHECSPTCALCGGPHLTADKACRQRFQVPYVVRRRRRQRKRAEKTPSPQVATSCRTRDPSVPRASTRARSATPVSHRSRSRGRSSSRGRSRSRVRIQDTAWADRVKQLPKDLYAALEPESTYGPRGRAEFMRYHMYLADRNALPCSVSPESRRDVLDVGASPAPSCRRRGSPGGANAAASKAAVSDKPKIVVVSSTGIVEASGSSVLGAGAVVVDSAAPSDPASPAHKDKNKRRARK